MPAPNDTKTGEQSPLLIRNPNAPTPAMPAVPAANGTVPDGATVSPESTHHPQTPAQRLAKADTNISWGSPAGLHLRTASDESLQIFRRALGINSHLAAAQDASSLEEGRKVAVGIYRAVLDEQRTKHLQFVVLSVMVYACHFSQIAIGAGLTALGPVSGSYSVAITALGAINTIIAGVLALVKGQGLPERLRKDEVEFRRLQDWIEETEALLAVGVIGRDRREVGALVESAFRKYNAAKASEENNKPDSYVRQRPEGEERTGSQGSDGSGNAIVRVGLPRQR